MDPTKFKIFSIIHDFYLRLVELTGLFVFFTAISTIIALISYCPEDPSFNTAIDGFVSNLLQSPGSYYSDLMRQFFGKSSYVFSFILMSFGYQLIRYHYVSFYRIVLGIFCCVFVSTFSDLLGYTAFSGVAGALSAKYLNKFVGKFFLEKEKTYWGHALTLFFQ